VEKSKVILGKENEKKKRKQGKVEKK